MRWERPSMITYGEQQLMREFAAGALASPIFLDAPLSPADLPAAPGQTLPLAAGDP